MKQEGEISREAALERVFAGRTAKRDGFCGIPTAVFVDGLDAGTPTFPRISFYRFDANGEAQEIRCKDEPFSPLSLSKNPLIWIREDEMPEVRAYAESLILNKDSHQGGDQKTGTPLSVEKRMETLRRSAILVCEDLFENPSPENINRSVKMVGSFVYVIMKDPKAYALLAKLSSHDPYTLQHSVGTAVHCVILGRKVGINNERELTELGTAGLLHDIGKTKVKREIINKSGPLSEGEWEEMRGHASEGYEIVKYSADVPERAKLAILEHHEDKNGTGYPLGKRTQEIDVFSRIVGICDIFNALTTDRTYSKARSPFDALQFMKEKLFHKVDEGLYKQLVIIYGGKLE